MTMVEQCLECGEFIFSGNPHNCAKSALPFGYNARTDMNEPYEPPDQDLNTYCMECGAVIAEANTFEGHMYIKGHEVAQDATVYHCDKCGYTWTE